MEIPELAIQNFEKWTGLTVTIHDLQGTLWPFLLPQRHFHCSSFCSKVKESPHSKRCLNFEITHLRELAVQIPDGRIHECHAGFIEWVTPHLVNQELHWMIFAGQRRLKDHPFSKDIHRSPKSLTRSVRPPFVTMEEAELFMEGLLQLRARLILWSNQQQLQPLQRKQDADRRAEILRVIQQNFREPFPLDDLASHLSLSSSRTSHLLRELFDKSFSDLVNDVRIRSAAAMLRQTSLPVDEIASLNGYQDPSTFFRAFRRIMRLTPARYRASAHSG